MNFFIAGVVIAFLVLLETSLLPYMPTWWGRPDLILVFTVFVGFRWGRWQGTLVGLTGGLLEDIMMGRIIGLSGFGKMAVGYLVGSLEGKLFKDNLFVPAILAFVGTFVYEALYCLIGTSFGLGIFPTMNPRRIVLASAIYNSLISGLAYGWSIRSSRRSVVRSTSSRGL